MPVTVTAVHEAPPQPVAPAAPVILNRNTVKNYTRFSVGDLRSGLEQAIHNQMLSSPQLFADEIVKDGHSREAYAKEFANHMLDKLSTESVKVLNETSVKALEFIKRTYYTGVEISLKGLYNYLFVGGKPQHFGQPGTPIAEKPKFKGC